MKLISLIIIFNSLIFSFETLANGKTETEKKADKLSGLKFNLNEEGSQYIKATGLAQIWLRHTDVNPGSTINGFDVNKVNDIGIRRLRFQVFGQVTKNAFFYMQFGQNNFNARSTKFTGSFFHDALGEIRINKERLSIGAGLTGWSGLLRYSSPAAGTILSLDAPLYQQATNSINDQFLRKLSIYAKGQIGKIDYRIAITDPMDIPGASLGITSIDSSASQFSPAPSSPQLQGYFKYQFFEHEDNTTPYINGTYLGEKKVLALGAGFISQNNAMWMTNTKNDTVFQKMLLLGADVFFETPLNENKSVALTIYSAFSRYEFGDNYLRYLGVMNPVNGMKGQIRNSSEGNAFPMMGTGNTFYFQSGILLGKNLLSEGGKIQPYFATQYSVFEALNDIMIMTEFGFNYYIHGLQTSKISLNYQKRPIYKVRPDGKIVETEGKGMIQVQLQVGF